MNNIVKQVKKAGASLVLIAGIGAGATALTVDQAHADALVTACAPAGQVINTTINNQCISAKIIFEGGKSYLFNVGNARVTGTASDAPRAFNIGTSVAAAFLQQSRANGYNVSYTHFQMGTREAGGPCRGSWAAFCQSAGISEGMGTAPRGVHFNNRVRGGFFQSSVSKMWEMISAGNVAVNQRPAQQPVQQQVQQQVQQPANQNAGNIQYTQTCGTNSTNPNCTHVHIQMQIR